MLMLMPIKRRMITRDERHSSLVFPDRVDHCRPDWRDGESNPDSARASPAAMNPVPRASRPFRSSSSQMLDERDGLPRPSPSARDSSSRSRRWPWIRPDMTDAR